jgi:hypothetical protein
MFLCLTLNAQVDTVWVVNGDTANYNNTSDIAPFVLNTYTSVDTNVVTTTTFDTIADAEPSGDFSYTASEDNENLTFLFERGAKSRPVVLFLNNVKVLDDYLTGINPSITFDTILNTNDKITMEFYGNNCLVTLTKTSVNTTVFIVMGKPNSVSNEFTEKVGLNIFPNPTTDFLNLNISNTNFVIFNTNGQLVKQGFLNDTRIDVMDLPTGYYIIKVNNENKTFIKR